MNILGLETLDEKYMVDKQEEPVYTRAFNKRNGARDKFIVKTRGCVYGNCGRKRKIMAYEEVW